MTASDRLCFFIYLQKLGPAKKTKSVQPLAPVVKTTNTAIVSIDDLVVDKPSAYQVLRWHAYTRVSEHQQT